MEALMTQIDCKAPEISERKTIARRQFLRFLAGSPLLTATSAGTIANLLAASSHQALAQSYDVLRGAPRALGPDGIILAPGDALDVFEFEPAAKKAVFAQGWPAWFMLYPTDAWSVTQALVQRAESAGSPAIVLTVDRQGGRNTEYMFRERRQDQRDCTACHQPGTFANEVSRKANFDGIDVSKVTNLYGTGMTWEFVDRLRATVKGKLVLKGIMTGEDAKEALRHGVDGLIVSNHGGRAEESGQATIRVPAQRVGAVGRQGPVLIDGGVRRGTHVPKAA